jgi:hypothetical protein
LHKGSSEDVRKVARESKQIRTDPKVILGNIASLIRDFFHNIKDGFFSQEKEHRMTSVLDSTSVKALGI